MPSIDAARGRGRPRCLSEAEELAVLEQREAGTAWKDLQERYDAGRTTLHEACERARKRRQGISEHFS